MAFSVIYDWRLHGKARPLSLRLLMPGQAGIAQSGAEDGTATAASHPFACAAPVAHRPDSRCARPCPDRLGEPDAERDEEDRGERSDGPTQRGVRNCRGLDRFNRFDRFGSHGGDGT